MKPMEKIKAVIYARYSSSNQREESIEGQLRECHAYARKNGLQVVGEYTDHALTGRTDKRPGFQKMIADSDKRQFEVVICWKMDRFARNRYDSAMYKYRLKKNGVRLAYAVESIPEGPEGIILESVMEGYAEYYSENLAQNIRRGLYENARACKVIGSTCFGYRKATDGRYEVDPIEGPMVQKVFHDYLAGIPSKQIAEELNAAGCRSNKGKRFTISAVNYILKNEKYRGVYRYKDILVENGVPALVTASDFEAVQFMLKKHSEAPAATQAAYLLSTKLHCGLCDETMVGEYATSRNGSRHIYYTCMGKRRHKCKMKRHNKEDLEKLIIDELIKLVFDDAFIEEVADLVLICQEKLNESTVLPTLEAHQRDLERKVKNTLRAIENGISTPSTAAHLRKLEADLEEVRTQIAQEIIKTPVLDRDHIIYFLESLRNGNPNSQAYKEKLVDTFLQGAYVYEDRIVIFLNYTGKKNPITKELADTLKAPQSEAFNAVRIEPVESRLLCQIRTHSAILTPEHLAIVLYAA